MSDDKRLNSWKEIAAYLQRDVRTVQRWEAEGLPVCRLRHDRLATVYAYSAEIDAWLKARSIRSAPSPIPQTNAKPTESASQHAIANRRRFAIRPAAALAIVGVVLGVAVGVGLALNRTANEPSSVSVEAGSALMRTDNWAAAEGVLRRVLEKNPTDPVAEIMLAWSVSNVGRRDPEGIGWADRAIGHITSATAPADEYFIRASGAFLHGDVEAAITLARNALAADPNRYWTIRFLAYLYSEVGYEGLAVPMMAKLSDLDPADGDAALVAATALFQYGDYEGALRYRDRALAASNENPYDLCWLRLLPAQIAWIKGDRVRAVALAEAAAANADLSTWQNDEIKRRAAEVIMLSGDRTRAGRLLDSVSDSRLKRFERLAWGAAGPDDALTAADLTAAIFTHDAALLAATVEGGFTGGIDLMRIAQERAQEPMATALLRGKMLQARDSSAALDNFLAAIRKGPMVRSTNALETLRIDIRVQFAGGEVGAVLQAMLGAAAVYSATGRPAEATRMAEQIASNPARALLGDVPGIVAWIRATEMLKH